MYPKEYHPVPPAWIRTRARGVTVGGALRAIGAVMVALFAWAGAVPAETISLPNGSFESPVTAIVDPRMDSWQKTPKPFWYDESGGYLWGQLTGVFANTAVGSADHIDNMDGNQAAFLFAVPQVGVFQDYTSIGGTNSTADHAFDAKFEPGKSYGLKVGVIGGGGGMTNGVTLQVGLYYQDVASNQVTVASTNIAYAPEVFTNTTYFVDFAVTVPAVKLGDAWAGKNIGVVLVSTVDPALAGGYWDLDNIRLTAIREPVLIDPAFSHNQFAFTLQSEPGLHFDILASTNLALPVSGWTSLGTVTNATGKVLFVDTHANAGGCYYQARQTP